MIGWIVLTLLVFLFVFLLAALGVYLFVRSWVLRLSVRVASQITERTSQVVTASSRKDIVVRLSSRMQDFAQSRGIPLDRARDGFFRHTQALANRTDNLFSLPVLGSVGLNGLFALVPFVGDAICAGLSMMVVLNALQFGLPRSLVSRMLANAFAQFVMGSIPFIGAIAVVEYRANTKNMSLLRKHLDEVRSTAISFAT